MFGLFVADNEGLFGSLTLRGDHSAPITSPRRCAVTNWSLRASLIVSIIRASLSPCQNVAISSLLSAHLHKER